MRPLPDTPFPAFAPHDHGACREATMGQVRAACSGAGLRLTAARERVLAILLESHAALGAYEILRRLALGGTAPQPPVVYRALEFLVRHGFAHRVERINAFVACSAPGTAPHEPTLLICGECRTVAEAAPAPLDPALARQAAAAGFAVERRTVEIEGTCAGCRDDRAGGDPVNPPPAGCPDGAAGVAGGPAAPAAPAGPGIGARRGGAGDDMPGPDLAPRGEDAAGHTGTPLGAAGDPPRGGTAAAAAAGPGART